MASSAPPPSHCALLIDWLGSSIAIIAQNFGTAMSSGSIRVSCVFYMWMCAFCTIGVSLLCGFIIGLDSIVYPEETWAETHSDICMHTLAHSPWRVWIHVNMNLPCTTNTHNSQTGRCVLSRLCVCQGQSLAGENIHGLSSTTHRHTPTLRRDPPDWRKSAWPLFKDIAHSHKPETNMEALGSWNEEEECDQCHTWDEDGGKSWCLTKRARSF